MPNPTEFDLAGGEGRIVVSRWSGTDPTFVVLLAHGYGEHSGRYGHVADRLLSEGAVVYAPDHLGHGRSDGERAHVKDLEMLVDDFRLVGEQAAVEHPGLPQVVVGHSMGGIVATRYAQRYARELTALVLSGPVIGGNPLLAELLALDPIPEVPIDGSMLSRDPAVGEAYMADPLVYHGGFQRETLQAFVAAVGTVAESGTLGELPTLWIHGEEDLLAPYDATAAAMGTVGGSKLQQKKYLGARHEIFNETNGDEVLDANQPAATECHQPTWSSGRLGGERAGSVANSRIPAMASRDRPGYRRNGGNPARGPAKRRKSDVFRRSFSVSANQEVL